MAVINHAKREINAKIVYYGPARSGKASLFRYIHQRIKPSLCGPLKSMPAGGDTLLFFDYLPFEHACLDGYQVRFHLYTLTGPVTNPGIWKMTLKGVDGLAVVSEVGQEQSETTLQAVRTLQSVVAGHGRELRHVPCILVSNKDDSGGERSAAWGGDLSGMPTLRSSAVTGEGVLQALAALSQAVVRQLREEHAEAAPVESEHFSTDSDVTGTSLSSESQPFELEQVVSSEAAPVLLAGHPTTLQLPVTLQVAGEPRRFSLRITLNLEEVADGDFGV